ncbi:MAG TPA: Crp/Fnr family transcriptional regulator [Streptosporangiaceae bacterium]
MRSFWKSLGPAERAAYAQEATEQRFQPGTVLFHEGTYASHVMVIKTGWATISAYIDGQERIIAIRGPGDLIGERAGLTRLVRSATVAALGDVTGMVVPAKRFRRLIAQHSSMRRVLESQERDRLAEDDKFLGGDVAAAEHRLAYLLRELTVRRGQQTPAGPTLSLPISPDEIARWVDANAEEIGRILGAWRRRGLISTKRHRLRIIDVRRLGEIYRPAAPQPPMPSGLNCSIFYVDVAEFGALHRDESDRQVVRKRLYEILRQVFDRSGVRWDVCHHEDRGDGVLVVVPPELPTRSVADPLLALLAAELRRHNRRASAAVRIQLRAALHVGPVTWDGEGVNGDAIIHTARMLDSPPLRRALRMARADLAFMASDYVFDTVLRHSPGLVDAREFAPVRFALKESQITAWLQVASSDPAAAHSVAEAVAASEPAGASRSAPERGDRPATHAHFHEAVRVKGDLVLGDKIIER